ncbi:hypothetical protein R75461_08259 [Paraburkholderia nemoris]|uniref:hypothetical protein n=1 Tax=Paraburkholderia nemoris TaxID=2793076 RepID=UPI00190DB9BA|nr:MULTISPECIES: hypothetical protein [Paraburkholderia]MBK3787200.1 hypothetical protein [Paraburkholderia aspalathi]CAE6865639.1 hypothetical protein R75461_08259 [Paraburkholderia nemoris]
MSDEQDDAHARDFVIGSLAWQIGQLEPGEFLFRPEANKSTRRICQRAIAIVTGREPAREYELRLWHAFRHAHAAEDTRVYRIKRVK